MAETQAAAPADKKQEHPKDIAREWVETIVFVVCLVLLLKAFVAEAFVIPTGSMADTRYGNHYVCECPQCKTRFAVGEPSRDAAGKGAEKPSFATCPNCRYSFAPGPLQGGDKVLVFKSRYDLYSRPKAETNRHDTMVFKYPGKPLYLAGLDTDRRDEGPQKDYAAYNYIKRVWGLPGERLAIWLGDVHLRDGPGPNPGLTILRKRPDIMLDMRILVYDNDFQAPDLLKIVPPRWQDAEVRRLARAGHAPQANENYWKAGAEDSAQTHSVAAGANERWLRYEHLAPESWHRDQERGPIGSLSLSEIKGKGIQPQLITDFMAYNAERREASKNPNKPNQDPYTHYWVSDLMLDVEAEVAESAGTLTLELVAGSDRHRAVFDLQSGTCALKLIRDGQDVPLKNAETKTKVSKAGKYRLRFANWDQRLTLWVDGDLVFGDGIEFPAPPVEIRGPRFADLWPAGVGARNAKLTLRKLQVWRDVFYTYPGETVPYWPKPASDEDLKEQLPKAVAQVQGLHKPDMPLSVEEWALHRATLSAWSIYAPQPNGSAGAPRHYPTTHPTQHPEDHFRDDEYFMLGDNSAQSADGRTWGQVPERLIMGKAVFVYFPFPPFGTNRLGLIR
jgi:signal peptidase I